MAASAGFVNLHPLFVHGPLVLIPVAAALTWIGRKIGQDRKEGFEAATLLLTIGAALAALSAIGSGWKAEATVPASGTLLALMEKHEINGVVVAVIACIAALLAIAEWRAWLGPKWWWPRVALLTFAAVGVVFSGQMGAEMVYLHGAAVAPAAERARAEEPAPEPVPPPPPG